MKSALRKHIALLTALLIFASIVLSGCAGKNGPDVPADTDLPAVPTDVPATGIPATEVPATDVPDEFYETREYSFIDNKDRFKIMGRSADMSKGVTCDWSAAGFAINAYCRGDVKLKLTVSGSCYFSVFVDGVKQEGDVLAKATTVLAKGLEAGEHLIEVFRQTEVRQGLVVLKSLSVEGELLEAPKDKPLRLVFIGDSISSGFGTNPKTQTGAEDHVDATLAYPFLVSRALDADFEIDAVIGIGLVKGYVTETMGEIFKYTDYYRSKKTEYTCDKRTDAVIINLGTNDATMSSDPGLFKEAVKALVHDVQAMYGNNVPIIWIYNSMRADHSKYTLEAIEDLKVEGINIEAEKFKADASAYGHPGVKAHQKDADQLIELLKSRYGIGEIVEPAGGDN
jgi:lysophospholipase L1-like esterase